MKTTAKIIGSGNLHLCKVCGNIKQHACTKSNTCLDCLAAGLKWCTKCEQVKPTSEFPRWGMSYGPVCKECKREYDRAYQKQRYNVDKEYRERTINKTAQSQDKRHRNACGSYTYDEWQNVLEEFNHECAYCGATGSLTVDHIIPLSCGGLNEIQNLVPACGSCNRSKCAKDVFEWYSSGPFYDQARADRIAARLAHAQPRPRAVPDTSRSTAGPNLPTAAAAR